MPEAKGRDFYDRDYFEARSRESIPHSRENVYPLAERTARLLCRRLGPCRLLDLGCAKGFLVEAFRALGVPGAFGADVSLYAVSEAGPGTRQRLVVANALAGLPFLDASCDLIAALDVFEHLPDPAPALGEIRRLLRKEGAAYLKICHPRHPNASRDPSHVNVQPLAYWHRAFARAGFVWERLYEAEFAPAGGRLEAARRQLRRLCEWATIGTPADYKFLLRKRPHAG